MREAPSQLGGSGGMPPPGNCFDPRKQTGAIWCNLSQDIAPDTSYQNEIQEDTKSLFSAVLSNLDLFTLGSPDLPRGYATALCNITILSLPPLSLT